jgi:hypothetical protein
MGWGSTGLDNYEYDQHLARNKKDKELRERRLARKNANKGYEGYHFGITENGKPVYTKDKHEFRKALEENGLMMRDDVKRDLR